MVPLTEAVLDDYLLGLADPEVTRLTGSSAEFAPEAVRRWLATRADQHDRADWAVLRRTDSAFLGEAVLNELDPENASVNFRIWLSGPSVGRGYGTQATALVRDHAFAVGLHRIALTVFAFNPRARRVYEKCGFVVEGRRRDVLWADGAWHDELVMSVLVGDRKQEH
nr:GNAT family protein [Nakamurella flavida]